MIRPTSPKKKQQRVVDTQKSSYSSTDATPALLIKAAKTIFAKKGFEGTTVQEIADLAGVNVSLVSYHFQGKQSLYHACFEQFGRSRIEPTRAILQAPKTLEEFRVRLGMFIDEFLNVHLSDQEITRMMHREFYFPPNDGEGYAPGIFKDIFFQLFSLNVEFFRSAQKAKFLRSDFDPEIVPGLIIGSLMHILCSNQTCEKHFKRSLHDEAVRKKIRDEILNAYINGLNSKGSSS